MPQMHTLSQSAESPSTAAAECALGFISWGVPFRLSTDNLRLLDLMCQQVPFGSVEDSSLSPGASQFSLRTDFPDGRFQLMMDGELIAAEGTVDQALAQLRGHLIVHVTEYAPEYVFVHAGVVAWQDRALLLPGITRAGKSTLVSELVRLGATYYSDEFALIDSDGKIHPFARDLRMRQPDQSEKTLIPLAQLNGRAGTQPLPVAMIVFAQFVENAHWAPEPVSPGRAVLETLLHTTPVRRSPARVLTTLTKMIRSATAWRSQRGDAAVAARSLLSALATGEAPV